MTRKPTIFDDTNDHRRQSQSKSAALRDLFKTVVTFSGMVPAVISSGIFCWATAGEMVLTEPYRFSTFLGERIGRIKAHEARASMAAEAERQELVTASQSFVQLKQQCQQARNMAAQQMFQQCIIGGVMTGCIYRRDQILALPCDHFLPEDLSAQFKKLVKNGESHD